LRIRLAVGENPPKLSHSSWRTKKEEAAGKLYKNEKPKWQLLNIQYKCCDIEESGG